MATHKRGSAFPDMPQTGIETGSFNTSDVIVTPPPPTAPEPEVTPEPPVSPVLAAVVPAAEPEALPEGFSRVNLDKVVVLNGRNIGPGVGCIVPTDAFDVWRHALAKE